MDIGQLKVGEVLLSLHEVEKAGTAHQAMRAEALRRDIVRLRKLSVYGATNHGRRLPVKRRKSTDIKDLEKINKLINIIASSAKGGNFENVILHAQDYKVLLGSILSKGMFGRPRFWMRRYIALRMSGTKGAAKRSRSLSSSLPGYPESDPKPDKDDE